MRLLGERGEIEMVKVLLENDKIDANATDMFGHTNLYFASWKGKRELVELLVKHKDIKINKQNGEGKTPLEIAQHELSKLNKEQEKEKVTKYTKIIELLGKKMKAKENHKGGKAKNV